MTSMRVTLCGAVALVFVTAGGVGLTAGRGPTVVPTFNQHVASILFNNCVACHRAGEAAPFSLTSYKEARPCR